MKQLQAVMLFLWNNTRYVQPYPHCVGHFQLPHSYKLFSQVCVLLEILGDGVVLVVTWELLHLLSVLV